MTNKDNKDGGQAPETAKPDGNGADKPGLVIDVVLPQESEPGSEPDPELGKKH